MTKLAAASLLIAICLVGAALGEGKPTTQPSRVAGSVLSRSITTADIQLDESLDLSVHFDAGDGVRWELMGRVLSQFGQPIFDRFVEQRKIEVTADEIATFHRTRRRLNERKLADVEADLARLNAEINLLPAEPPEPRQKLEQRKAALEPRVETLRRMMDHPNDQMARLLIQSWKIERELKRAYGGRIIFQQFGLEALDGRRRLFEEAEKQGDLKFADPAIRRMFYHYFDMGHAFVKDDQALEKPWFLEQE
jgi:hypothetical protein